MDTFGLRFSRDFQLKVLTLLLTRKTFFKQVSGILVPGYFESDDHQFIYKTIISYFSKYSELPTMEVFTNTLKKVEVDDPTKVKAELKKIWGKIESSDLDYVEDETLQFCKNQELKNAILDSVKYLELGDYDRIKTRIDNALKVGQNTEVGLDLKTDILERYSQSRNGCISTGFPIIDDLVGGGMAQGDLIIVGGPPGAGKTWLLTKVGAGAAQAGYRVAHYSLELDKNYVGFRYDTIYTGISLDKLKDNIPAVEKVYKNLKGNAIVQEYPTKGASVLTIKAHLDRLILMDQRPDVVIVDYADLLKLPQTRQDWQELQDLIAELRGMAKEYRVPVVTASQIGRDGAQDDVITGDKIAGSFGKLMVADVVVSLSRTEKDKQAGTGRIHIIKNRFGVDGITFPCKIDWGKGYIEMFLPSSKEAEEIEESRESAEKIVIQQTKSKLAEKYKSFSKL